MSTAVVEQLREKIRKLEAQPRELVMALRTGVEALDAFGAFRLGSGVELCGEEASGRTTIALSLVAAAGREKRLSAWVDGPSELYPPAAAAMGVSLERLLIARPKAPGQLVWTAMQLLRSGAFTCVVLDVTHTGVQLGMTDAKKLLDAARTGGSLLVLITSATAPGQGFVRLMLRQAGASLSLRQRGEGRGEGPAGGVRSLEVVRTSGRSGPSTPLGVNGLARSASTPLGPDADSISPTFQIDAPHGRHAVLRGKPLRGRRLARPWPAPEVHPVLPLDSLQRPKKNLLRDGYPMTWGRPGRDSPLTLPLQRH
ncbi:MAG: recombinase RecA [Archangium sp.]|nr:recombinase RecA [Archangium sp.]